MSGSGYNNPHQSMASPRHGTGGPFYPSSPSGGRKSSSGSAHYPYYSTTEISQPYHSSPPEHRIQHNRPDNYQYQPTPQRSNEYDQRSPAFEKSSEANYHPANGERKRMYHSVSSSSNITQSSSMSAPHSHQGATHMRSPSEVARTSSSYKMEPAAPLPHRASYPGTTQASFRPNAHPSTSPPSATERVLPYPIPDRKVSCMECRTSKVKCTGQSEDGNGCERCKRINRNCVFEQHRRGRKPAQIKIHKLEQSVDTIMTALSAFQEYKQQKGTEDESDSIVPLKRRANSDSLERQTLRPLLHLDTKSDESNEQSREATVRATDLEADESSELGLPPMSNPLKLLAQASDSAMEHGANSAPPLTGVGYDALDQDGQHKVVDQMRTKQPSSERTERGASRREYWSLGLYSSRFDKGPLLDPVHCNIMTKKIGKDLYQFYMKHLNDRITLLDPYLATFDYVRSHSALLLTSSCALAARFASHIPNAEQLANKLDAHVQEKLLPAVLLQGYRSVEISQAFIIMAAFHQNTSSLDGDRSWSLLGYGIRIAAELDMNARMISDRDRFNKTAHTPSSTFVDTPASSRVGEEELSADEAFQRKIRNRERTWCNLWLFENSLSTHMGRRSTLGQDPVILGVCAGWNRGQYAIPGDEAIVALINLRRLQIKNSEFFEHSILSDVTRQSIEEAASKKAASASLKFQMDFYRSSCSADIDAWRAMYVEGEEGQSVRMQNARLYLSYARLILNSFALKCTLDQALLEPIYKESYNSAMTYLTLFSERLESPELVYVHNSAVVTVAYVAVFALRLCSLDAERHPYINTSMVFDHVRALSKALARAGSVTSWRNGAATSYAPYLSAVLYRVEKTVNRARNNDSIISPSAPMPAGSRNGKQGDPIVTPPILNGSQNHKSQSVTAGDYSNLLKSPAKRLAFAPNTDEFNAEALTFMAGPSGVQASAILEELAITDGLQIGQNFFEDQVMDASLFHDMSIFLNDQNHTTWLTPSMAQ